MAPQQWQPSISPQPQFRTVETPEVKEQTQIEQQAVNLLKSGDYDALDALAAKYRASKECYANGIWKLFYVYVGLGPGGNDSEATWKDRQGQVRDWIAAKTDSVTARVTMAHVLADYAWKARGGGWADSVTDEGWRLFGDRLQQAAQQLHEAARLKEKCPVYWSTAQHVALGIQMDRPQYDAVFRQAIAQFPDYVGIYNHRAEYLLPRWYGEDGDLERDLEKSADRIGGEAGDILYARVVWYLHRCVSSSNVFKENNLSWERTERGFDAILKKFPDSLAAKNEAAHLSWLAGDQQNARKFFLLTKAQVDLSQWDNIGQFIKWYFWSMDVLHTK